MRLINVETMKIEQFFGDDVPSYLILSHTWTAEEISFQDYAWLLNHQEEVAEGIIDELTPKQRARVLAKAEALRQRSGYKKILGFTSRAHELREKHGCPATHNQAKAGGLYVWVDTCCINKESSAELSEAINSMYTWYANALLCVAVLTDVAGTESDPNGEFGDSRWFTRGWTLQELVAPLAVVLYNSSYELIGSRSDLARSIARITSIDQKYLHSPALGRTSASPTIAERMSWAAGRQTTRLEDEAYCLLGIFGVNMPLLYGEGANAFVRLQQEIIKSTEDQTIFAWGYNMSVRHSGGTPSVVFSKSVSEFCYGGKLDRLQLPQPGLLQESPRPFEMTNLGLRISLSLFRLSEGIGKTYAILPVIHKDGGHICVPVTWRAHGEERIEKLSNGAVIERCTPDQPVVCDVQGLRRDSMTLVERSVILSSERRAVPLPQSIDPSEHFTVVIALDPLTCILEAWSPNMESDWFAASVKEPELILRGSSNSYRWDHWPLFVRARSRDPNATEDLIAISFNFEPVRVNWIKTFDWESVRRLAYPPVQSVLGLYVSSVQPGGPAMRSALWPESSSTGGVELKFKGFRWTSATPRLSSRLATESLPMTPVFSFSIHKR